MTREEIFLFILNKIWNENSIPEDWKEAYIIPNNKSEVKLNCSNYRGITLINICINILKKIKKNYCDVLHEYELKMKS